MPAGFAKKECAVRSWDEAAGRWLCPSQFYDDPANRQKAPNKALKFSGIILRVIRYAVFDEDGLEMSIQFPQCDILTP